MKALRLLLLAAACTLPGLAAAQWQWIDKDGRKVFSDQSPPPDIPAKNILKQPGGRALHPRRRRPANPSPPRPPRCPGPPPAARPS